MTTAAQVKKLVQPLLARNSDLVLVGRLLVVRPTKHILRSIFFDASWNKDLFRPYWALNMMFESNASHGPTWGERIYPRARDLWLFSDPDISELACNQLEEYVLPVLRSVNSIKEFTSYATKENFPHTWLDAFPFRRIFAEIALGDFEAANESCERVAAERKKSDFIAEILDPIIEDVWPLVRERDKVAIAKMLHQQEAKAAERMKLKGIWEPSAFPLELD
jgi:hypothetical protein